MGEDGKLNLAPMDIKVDSDHSMESFHGGTAKKPGMMVCTAEGRMETLGIWTRRGFSDRPAAVKPLRDGKMLGLAPCGLDVPGRLPLKWRKKGQEVSVNLVDLLPRFDIRIPRGQLMDVGMTIHTDPTWGEVLVCNLDNPPFRPQQRRSSRQAAPPAEPVKA